MVLHTTDYPCSYEGNGNLVPSCYLVCPHCSEPKAQHHVTMFTRVCGKLLNSNILVVPLDQREVRQFDGRLILSGSANAFPE